MKIRPRINRSTASRRDLNFSNSITDSLVQPHFVVSGDNVDENIDSMPGINHQSVDILIDTIKADFQKGIRNHMLFPVLDQHKKDSQGTYSISDELPLYLAISSLREEFGDKIVIMADVCMCTYTNHGHCGIIHEGDISNDLTIPKLINIALKCAEAGVDYIAASDMMDGRVKEIRKSLDENEFKNTGIMSYSVKYASSFYGPFRDAANSSPESGDRKTHQMDVRSGYDEAKLEVELDIKEGADIIMIKPAMIYLDVVREISKSTRRPVAVYNVSGEYAMVMSSNNSIKEREKMINEIFYAFKRSGANIIVSYHTREAIYNNWLK